MNNYQVKLFLLKSIEHGRLGMELRIQLVLDLVVFKKQRECSLKNTRLAD